MKKFILLAFLSVQVVSGMCQSVFGFYGGAGASVNYNYDVGLTGGITYMKEGMGRVGIGADLFYQSLALKYDNEQYGVKNGTGNAGMIILDKSSYVFVAPKINYIFGRLNTLEAYLTVGAGFKMGGTETMRKWDRGSAYNVANYDSTINTSDNLNTMLFRIGLGMTEYIHVGFGLTKWWFTVTEDFGFIPSSVTKSSDLTAPQHTQYSPSGKLNPYFISLYIGLFHTSAVTEAPTRHNR